MNYKAIYNSLIDKARNRTLVGYVENHHILPKCLGGSDDPSNLVSLTAEEHFVAHQLLVKMHPENGKLIFAAHMMTRSNYRHIRNNKEYSWLKKRRSVYISSIQKGVKKGPYGTRRKLPDPYQTAIEIENFKPLEKFYLKTQTLAHLLTPAAVLEIHSILWTYGK